jgi:uncharacterized protein YndB with AHSA1/START domain
VKKVFEIYIRTTPERLWEALTSGEMRRKYAFGLSVKSDWSPGSRYEQTSPDGRTVWVKGENLVVEPPHRLVQTMVALWSDEIRKEPPSQVTLEIEPAGNLCHLTVSHDKLREDANDELYGGWPMILSSLKSLLEPGESLDIQIPAEALARFKGGQSAA